MGHVDWACDLARTLLEEPLPRRWAHTQGVATRAASLIPVLGDDIDLVTSAAWLHDIGYTPNLVVAEFHPLDGARYLRDTEHAEEHLCRLVAHHSCAVVEAEERGRLDQLNDEFDLPRSDLLDALTYSDMTTTPDGHPTTVEQRIADIQARYGPNHLVHRSITRAAKQLEYSVDTTQAELDGVSHTKLGPADVSRDPG